MLSWSYPKFNFQYENDDSLKDLLTEMKKYQATADEKESEITEHEMKESRNKENAFRVIHIQKQNSLTVKCNTHYIHV